MSCFVKGEVWSSRWGWSCAAGQPWSLQVEWLSWLAQPGWQGRGCEVSVCWSRGWPVRTRWTGTLAQPRGTELCSDPGWRTDSFIQFSLLKLHSYFLHDLKNFFPPHFPSERLSPCALRSEVWWCAVKALTAPLSRLVWGSWALAELFSGEQREGQSPGKRAGRTRD